MVPSRMAGNSQLSSNFGNTSNSGQVRAHMVPVSGDLSNTVLTNVANSGPSVGESSLVTVSNSVISGGPQFQRSTSFNTESYMRLPTSPMSFTSNNISVSGSSIIDGSSVMQQSSNEDQVLQEAERNQHIHGASSATSLPKTQLGQAQLAAGARFSSPFMHDLMTFNQLQKRPRLDIKQEDFMQQPVLQQLLQRQDSGHLQNPNPQLQALIQQQRKLQEQQLLQSMSPMQRIQFFQQQQQQQQLQQQLQLRQQQLRVQGMQPAIGPNRPFDGGVCSRRLMQYLYHMRQRPVENAIVYWRKFVAEYYSPRAKKRWCLSQYDSAGHHSLGVFPQASQDSWQCDICGSKSGRGFEATFEVLPRLNEIKFSSGVIDELLFLDLPREYRFPTGMMVLEYAKAVQESVYDHLRMVREGQLRILFTPELKILSWEFCARRHEELIPRRVFAPQVNHLLQAAQKCQTEISESGANDISQQDLQANSTLVVNAGLQLVKSLELQSLNDLGFSKRYVRCLQIADVVNSMKDLIDFCRVQKVGPIEGLKNFPRRTTSEATSQIPLKRELGPAGDQNSLNKLMTFHPGLNINTQFNGNRGALSGSAALASFQNSTVRQNSMNSAHYKPVKQEPSSGLSTPNQAPSPSMTPRSSVNVSQYGISKSQQLNRSMSANGMLQNQSLPSQQGGQALLQQRMMQQMLQDMSRKRTFSQQTPSVQNPSGNAPSRSNGFKMASNGESHASAAAVGYNGINQRSSDMAQNINSSDAMLDQDDVISQFTEGGFFDAADLTNFDWKA